MWTNLVCFSDLLNKSNPFVEISFSLVPIAKIKSDSLKKFNNLGETDVPKVPTKFLLLLLIKS